MSTVGLMDCLSIDFQPERGILILATKAISAIAVDAAYFDLTIVDRTFEGLSLYVPNKVYVIRLQPLLALPNIKRVYDVVEPKRSELEKTNLRNTIHSDEFPVLIGRS